MVNFNNVVKSKKLQRVGDSLCVIIPTSWIEKLNWNQETKLVLEFLPNRRLIMLSNEKNSNIEPDEH